MIITAIKIVLVLVLCIWSSITDIQNGLVSNKLIAVTAALGIIVDIIGWAVYDSSYLTVQITNIGIVWLISILMYAFHIWAGGDCKLMMVISCIMPYELYAHFFNESVALVSVLAFTFILGYVYLLYDTVNYAVKNKQKVNKEKVLTNLKSVLFRWISCVIYITLADQTLGYFFSAAIAKFRWMLIVINICIVLIITGVEALRNKYAVLSVLIIGIILKVVWGQPIFSKFMVINYSLAILFIVLRLLINEYDYEIINTSQVEKGMILSLATTLQFANSKVQGLPPLSKEDLRSRLSAEEAENVRRWAQSKYGTDTVEIVRKMPFAIFISLGSVLFMILGAVMK